MPNQKPIFAVYDTTGIQSYIFSSNKLSENVGASRLVRRLFYDDEEQSAVREGVLPSIVREFGGNTDYAEKPGRAFSLDSPAEIIFYGGGNAYVAYRDQKTFQKVTERFLRKVYECTHSVGIAVAAVETEFGNTYQADYRRLNARLALAKGGLNRPVPAGNQAITRQSTRTGMPVVAFEKRDREGGEWLSREQVLKREADEKRMEFDKLCGKEESFIAVVHADGNNMGRDISAFIADAETYADAVPKMRGLSLAIDKAFADARRAANEMLAEKDVPYIELITDGDDTTIVLPGKYAIAYAAALLREIEKQPSPFGDASKLTACAGVSIFHRHYPFSSAYMIAEDACASAKGPSRTETGSYIDFHLHQSGTVLDLSRLRERQYTLDGEPLYARPWKISGDANDVPDFSWFETMQRDWKNKGSQEWPRSRLKGLRNALGAGVEAAKLYIEQCASRGYVLPKDRGAASQNDDAYLRRYYDVLELADEYEEV
ncbi:MAG: hypothetical protein LBP30_01890 [Clostridiales Family XIII bacterium]|nr:hypothetical protein [Clostridiales Family XIII bacterium]